MTGLLTVLLVEVSLLAGLVVGLVPDEGDKIPASSLLFARELGQLLPDTASGDLLFVLIVVDSTRPGDLVTEDEGGAAVEAARLLVLDLSRLPRRLVMSLRAPRAPTTSPQPRRCLPKADIGEPPIGLANCCWRFVEDVEEEGAIA